MKYLALILASVFTLSLATSQDAFAASQKNYCAALRGNGQMAPAQWVGMARIIEHRGMPTAMAGGSSSTLTMFFIESINKSKAVRALSSSKDFSKNKKHYQALLVKSLPLFITTVADHLQLESTYKFLAEMKASDSDLNQLIADVLQNRGDDLELLNQNLVRLGPLFNDDIAKSVLGSLAGPTANPENLAIIGQRVQEARAGFGGFQPAKDRNLFFRPGLIDFKQFALSIGKAADFYSGHGVSAEVLEAQQNFLERCATSSQGQVFWPNPLQASCAGEFAGLVLTHIKESGLELDPESEVFSKIGESIPSFAITAVIVDEGFEHYQQVQSDYNSFKVQDTSEFSVGSEAIQFGYWLPPQTEIVKSVDLSQPNQLTLPSVRYPNDLKSQKFLELGSGSWFDALVTSPAEPGLTNMQMIPSGNSGESLLAESQKPYGSRWTDVQYKQGMVSAGGWPDLHPTQILKSYQPCQDADVFYLTRKGAASTFGQQTFVILAGLEDKIEGWDQVSGAHNYERFIEGTPAEGTDWDRLHNVTNPESSFNQSLL
ncbi:MAG: hypothetical protein AAF202_02895 [Pseudomonadota bacterium]